MFLQLLLAYQVMSLNSESGNVTNSGDIINHQETHISDEKQELWYINRVEYSPLIFVEAAKCLAEIAFLYYQYYWNLVEKDLQPNNSLEHGYLVQNCLHHVFTEVYLFSMQLIVVRFIYSL